ncbi:S8 family serine peptidase [Vulcaniibacterium gelatinicum]|uniref:S8 family serine peptidase n=1 Tax=Vulcaniibacterium gelatinicum TaxID=2598725 RepID=UPI0011CBBB86|nr:S8 family serine peptidase [Vulcaniibacterium gelatinicum]
MARPARTLLGLAVAAGLSGLAAPAADAAALISPDLQQRLQVAPTHEVIVTYTDPRVVQRLALLTSALRPLEELPMAGALLTTAQVREVASWDGVESLYFNAPLRYYNHEAAEITGGHLVHDGIGLKGRGITVAVIDSGIDANHPDLQFGSKTIQNVKIVADLGLLGVGANVENLPDTDTSSGHGTHVAGTVAGTGAVSAADPRRPNYYDGIAPEASLVGLSVGEGINILFALEAFDYALANQQRYGIDIITNSWGASGGGFDPGNPINQASYEAYKRGMVVTFAAGNDGPAEDTLNPYAIAPWVINVGSGTKSGDLSSFSSRGVAGDFYKHVDVVAPGSNIVSTRAVATPLPALGPVLNPSNPTYTAYYASMSGTSMATPFVAGTAALLLEANPELSPDQIEQILVQTATPMPAYGYHVVGGGYINVFKAVELASRTQGNRAAFLRGETAWSSQGQWNTVGDGNGLLAYAGNWQTASSSTASDGSYRKSSVTKKSVPRLHLAFHGEAMQLLYPRDARGGLADVYVDGVFRGRISFYNGTADTARFALNNLSDGLHKVELRGVTGNVYFDGALLDGQMFPVGTQLVEETETFTGTLGPSAENLEVDEFPFEVGQDTVSIKARLSWSGGVDVDFCLVNPAGEEVACGATLANPETLEYAVTEPGTYRYRVKGYATLLASYTLTSTETRAVVSTQ